MKRYKININTIILSRLAATRYIPAFTAMFITGTMATAFSAELAKCQLPETGHEAILQQPEPNHIDNIYTLNTEGNSFILDLETGMILSPTETLSDQTKSDNILSDAIKNGFDLVNGITIEELPVKPFNEPVAVNCSVTAIDNSFWIAPKITILIKRLMPQTQYTPMHPENGLSTYLLITADKNYILMQITALRPEQNHSKIEYKFMMKEKASYTGFAADPAPQEELVLLPGNLTPEKIGTLDLPGLPGSIPVYNMPGNNDLKTQLIKAMKQKDLNNDIKMPEKKGQWTVRFVDTANDVYIGEPMPDIYWDRWYYYPNQELYERSRDYFYGSGDYKRLEVKYEIKFED